MWDVAAVAAARDRAVTLDSTDRARRFEYECFAASRVDVADGVDMWCRGASVGADRRAIRFRRYTPISVGCTGSSGVDEMSLTPRFVETA